MTAALSLAQPAWVENLVAPGRWRARSSRRMFGIAGPRGVDVQFDGSNAAFPVYDIHGSMKAILNRASAGFATSMWRNFDVWGSVRSGQTAGGSLQRCCASLGHVADDESGLIYMRARFYEPSTGRFVSEDPAMNGANWFVYCRGNSVGLSDSTGRISEEDQRAKLEIAVFTAAVALGWLVHSALLGSSVENKLLAWSGLTFLAAWFNIELHSYGTESLMARVKVGGIFIVSCLMLLYPAAACVVNGAAGNSPAVKAVDLAKTYSAILTLFLALESLETQ